jgi:protein gp37
MPKTSIEWCDYSWPVVNGCRRISAGCGTGRAGGCYAERLAATRLKHTERYRGLAVMTEKGPQWTGETRLIEKELAMPLKLRKPSRIFVADMGDLFYDGVPDEQIAAVFGVIAAARRHTFQCLTKRPARAREWFAWLERQTDRGPGLAKLHPIGVLLHYAQRLCEHPALRDLDAILAAGWPLRNVDLGVSVEDQATADERIPVLLSMREHVGGALWVSLEPQIGPVDFTRIAHRPGGDTHDPRPLVINALRGFFDGNLGAQRALDWIVVGGESGPGARPFDVAWARSTIAQCRAAGVPVFVKQLGTLARDSAEMVKPGRDFPPVPRLLSLRDRKGGDMAEWPEDLRVRELPEARR